MLARASYKRMSRAGRALGSLVFYAAMMAGFNAAAQDAPSTERASFWDLALGANALELDPEQFADYACGTNGGPPSTPINGWADFAQCRPEAETGLHEVQFRYDDEAEYWARANNLTALVERYGGTKLFNLAVIVSALFDDDGFLVGLRAVTDPRVNDDLRMQAISLRNFLLARYDPNSWTCEELPQEEGEIPIGDRYLKEACTNSTEQADLRVESHFFRKPGQFGIDPRTNQPVAGLFESSVRFEMMLNHPIENREQRLAEIAANPRPPTTAEMNRERALDCPGCDLHGLDLKHQDLTGANLAGANLSGANLHGAILTQADLSGADLTDANLNRATLRQANLAGATMTGILAYGALADGVDLGGADLSHGHFQESRLTRANLDDALAVAVDFTGATLSAVTARRTDFGGSWFNNGQLNRGDFTGADFRQTLMQNVVLTDADLTDASFDTADLIGADLRGATLTRTDFNNARLTQVNLADTNREDALMENAFDAPP
jgi:uncharacterized protein YjbI with pentapeptide repeats